MKTFLIAIVALFTVTAANSQEWLDHALKVKADVTKSNSPELPYVSKVMKLGDAPLSVSIDVTKLNELVLITNSTADGADFDHAVWADAVLIDADGKEHRIDQMDYKFLNIEGNWFRKTTNFGGENFSIAKKTYKHGVLNHANGTMIIDLKGKNFKTFKSDIGIDNGSQKGSVQFKVLEKSGMDEAANLVKQFPEITTELLPYINSSLQDWLTSNGTEVEKNAILSISEKIENKDYLNNKIEAIEALSTEKEKVLEYIKLNKEGQTIIAVQQEIEWVNPTAVVKAYNHFSQTKNYNKAKFDAKMAEFKSLTKEPFTKIYSLDKETIVRARKALALRREILLSNPALDMDKILVSRYQLGAGARYNMAEKLGYAPNNYSSLLSNHRTGYDAELIELSNLRGEIKERSVFKPKDGNILSDVLLHWDADKVLFTSNSDNGSLQVFEVGMDGKNHKRMTNLEDTDIEIFDAAYLPSGKLMVASNVGYNGVPCVNGSDAVSTYSLYDPETDVMRRLTFDQDNNWDATVLRNGRVMYTRWEYTDLMHYYSRIVFHMNPDGTEQKALFGSGAMFPNSTFDMQQLPGNGNQFIGVISGHHGVVRSGRLIIFDPTKARKGVEGMIQELPHSQRPIINFVKDELVNGVWPQFLNPHPITDEYFLVTAKLTPTSLWGIYLIDIYDNLTLITEIEGAGLVNPIPVTKKPTPAMIPEKIEQDPAKFTTDEATVLIQDIYEGEGLPGVPRGTVKELRVLAYEFAYNRSLSDHVNNGIQSGWDIKRELGKVKVEADGSVVFKIPANTPISLQPLDSTGAAIQLMRSWFVGMPGEIVSCVGCHEDQNLIPINKRTIASQKKADTITTPYGGPRPYTFEAEIQPILNRACIACHDGETKAGGIDYRANRMDSIGDWSGKRYFSKSYLSFHPYFYRQGPEAEMAVLNPYEYHVQNSEMIQMLKKGHHNVKLTDNEWDRLITWVDFNLPYNGVMVAEKFVATDKITYDQYTRRQQHSQKYAGHHVDWKKELSSYMADLKSQGKVTPTMPEQVLTKTIKVKEWGFNAEQAKAMQTKTTKTVDLGGGVTMDFVWIPNGSFYAGDDGLLGTLPAKKAKVKGFWMAATEVTNEQMRALVPTHDSRYIGQQWKDHTNPGYLVDSAYFPATKVSFDNAIEFTNKLSAKAGVKATLPTETQWEWAARAGSEGDFWFGTANTDFSKFENLADEQLNKMAVSGIDPQPMDKNNPWYRFQAYIPKDNTVNDGAMLMTKPASYQANPWGLYDMIGNVAEWTISQGNGQNYVVRGGSWYDRAKKAPVTLRREFLPWHQVWNVGFRPILLDK